MFLLRINFEVERNGVVGGGYDPNRENFNKAVVGGGGVVVVGVGGVVVWGGGGVVVVGGGGVGAHLSSQGPVPLL